MKLLYCSYSRIPSATANSIAVVKQCAALADKCQLRCVFIRGKEKKNYKEIYHVGELPMNLLPSAALWYNEFLLRKYVVFKARAEKVQMVYSRDVFLNDALNQAGIPNIYEIHQLDQGTPDFDGKFKKVLAAAADSDYTQKIVCISEKLRRECIDFGIEAQKLCVLHSGVDISEYQGVGPLPYEEIKFPRRQMLAVYAGSLQPGKGVEIIETMAEQAPWYNFLIIGGQEGAIAQRENLRQITWIEHTEVIRYLKTADFLLLPMTKQVFQFHSPLKLFEYLAAGKVVIASDLSNIREIIVPGVNGLLAEPGNAASFLEKMNAVCSTPLLREKIEKNAMKTAQQYSWDRRAQSILDYIQKEANYK